jgi:hypothetical protein
MEKRHKGELDVVLLNVDNPRWQPQIDTYAVNGIPHLELFDRGGQRVSQVIGARSSDELELLGSALVAGTPLPPLAGSAPTSTLEGEPSAPLAIPIAPRSHG